MAETKHLPDARENELVRVVSWRLHVLIEAGYPLEVAERIAQSDADLHRAVELVAQGCAFETAEKILT